MIPLLKVSFLLQQLTCKSGIFFLHEPLSSSMNSYTSFKWEAQKCHLDFLDLVIPFSNSSRGVTAFRICFHLQEVQGKNPDAILVVQCEEIK